LAWMKWVMIVCALLRGIPCLAKHLAEVASLFADFAEQLAGQRHPVIVLGVVPYSTAGVQQHPHPAVTVTFVRDRPF
jgi:preprotein translocase subunit SecY